MRYFLKEIFSGINERKLKRAGNISAAVGLLAAVVVLLFFPPAFATEMGPKNLVWEVVGGLIALCVFSACMLIYAGWVKRAWKKPEHRPRSKRRRKDSF